MLSVFLPEKLLKFPSEVVIWWTLKMYFWEVVNSEYSRTVMRLVRFLLHCYASNLVFKILKHDKIWGAISISDPTPILRRLVPASHD